MSDVNSTEGVILGDMGAIDIMGSKDYQTGSKEKYNIMTFR